MPKRPWFRFWVADFLNDESVVLMTNEEVGVYVKLLAHHWIEGSLPGDESKLASLSNVSRKLWMKIRERILPCFFSVQRSGTKNSKGQIKRLMNPRMQLEMEEANRVSDLQRGRVSKRYRGSTTVESDSYRGSTAVLPETYLSESRSESESQEKQGSPFSPPFSPPPSLPLSLPTPLNILGEEQGLGDEGVQGGEEPRKNIAPDGARRLPPTPEASKTHYTTKNGFTAADLQTIWNHTASLARMTKCLKLTRQRKRLAELRIAEEPDPQYWREVASRIGQSRFCCGENDRGWKANFDFLIRPNTHVSAMEGKYDLTPNPPGSHSRTSGNAEAKKAFLAAHATHAAEKNENTNEPQKTAPEVETEAEDVPI